MRCAVLAPQRSQAGRVGEAGQDSVDGWVGELAEADGEVR